MPKIEPPSKSSINLNELSKDKFLKCRSVRLKSMLIKSGTLMDLSVTFSKEWPSSFESNWFIKFSWMLSKN